LKRKLLLLNTVLVALLAYAGWQLRQAWLAARAREAAELNRKAPPSAPPPFTPLPTAAPVAPGGYAEIATQMLFDKSRNPNVVVEVPAAAPAPPPKPMPPLPVYHGQMNIGSGPTAILSQTATGAHEAIHPGEQIGQFKLLDVNSDEIAFEWDGNTVRRKVDTLIDRSAAPPAVASTAGRIDQPAAAPPPAAKTQLGPGEDTGRGPKVCQPNDSSPAGAVVDGYRKVIAPTPFGDSCRWDPVGR
jgi:hypothetical protein